MIGAPICGPIGYVGIAGAGNADMPEHARTFICRGIFGEKSIRHPVFRAKCGENIIIKVSIIDDDKLPVNVENAEALYRVAADAYPTLGIIEKTENSGIAFEDSVVIIFYNTSELDGAGIFRDQLSISLDGNSIYVLDGTIILTDVIGAPD